MDFYPLGSSPYYVSHVENYDCYQPQQAQQQQQPFLGTTISSPACGSNGSLAMYPPQDDGYHSRDGGKYLQALPAIRRSGSSEGSGSFEMDTVGNQPQDSLCLQTESTYGETSSSARAEYGKKQTHSEIEKRRRDKMNNYIIQLSKMIPACHSMSKRLDKLSVLRHAVNHFRTIKGNSDSFTALKEEMPSFVSRRSAKDLLLENADGFLLVMTCNGAKILFVSDAIGKILNYTQKDLLYQSWFNFLRSKDVAQVKEQLMTGDVFSAEPAVEKKISSLGVDKFSMPLRSEWFPGSRRSFFCKMKYKKSSKVDITEGESSPLPPSKKRKLGYQKKYCVLHCVGYLKTISAQMLNMDLEPLADFKLEQKPLNCLVVFARTVTGLDSSKSEVLNIQPRITGFSSRHSKEGKFIFLDQRVTLVLEYLPQDLVATSIYEYCHPDDMFILADSHRKALLKSDHPAQSDTYRVKTKSGSYVGLQTTWSLFTNPSTQEFVCLMAMSHAVPTNIDNRKYEEPQKLPPNDSVKPPTDQSYNGSIPEIIVTAITRQASAELAQTQAYDTYSCHSNTSTYSSNISPGSSDLKTSNESGKGSSGVSQVNISSNTNSSDASFGCYASNAEMDVIKDCDSLSPSLWSISDKIQPLDANLYSLQDDQGMMDNKRMAITACLPSGEKSNASGIKYKEGIEVNSDTSRLVDEGDQAALAMIMSILEKENMSGDQKFKNTI